MVPLATSPRRTDRRPAVSWSWKTTGFATALWGRAQPVVFHDQSVGIAARRKTPKRSAHPSRLDENAFFLLTKKTPYKLRRDMAQLRFVADQIQQIEKARETRLEKAPREGVHPMVLTPASIKGVGLETAEMLVVEVLSRKLRDRRAVARYGGLTGSPDESGSRSRERVWRGRAMRGVRRGMIQLAWRFLMFQKDSALAKWFQARTANGPRGVRKTMIVALARKLLIDLWRFVEDGVMPTGVVLFDPA